MDITVFTTTYCASCKTLKAWLDSKKINYSTVNLEENPERQQEIFSKSGSLSVPITIIVSSDGTETVVKGPNFGLLATTLGI